MEKTVLISCSPKKHMSVSGFIAKCTGFMIHGEKIYTHLRNASDHPAILSEIQDADKVIFFIPLYVDSVPSHMLSFMKKMEAFCHQHQLKLKVYVIGNNGFIEGRQNEPMMQVMENFCIRSGIEWRGGIGIGGGVMLNVTRIMLGVIFCLTVLNVIINAFRGQSIVDPIVSFATGVLENAILCCGIIAYLVRLALHINRGTHAGKKYTRIMLPSFVFILFADIFFSIISIFQGGVFRGWFKRFKPTAECGILTSKNK